MQPCDIPFHTRQRTFIALFPHFLSRQCFHHKKNIIYYTKTRQSYHINNILQRMGKRGIEPPMFTTWELIYSQLQHRQSLPLPRMRGRLTPYLCTRPRYAYSIRSARHHRNGRIRTFACKRAPNSHKKELNLDSPPLSRLSYVPKPPSDG